jgi:hypothetical protein
MGRPYNGTRDWYVAHDAGIPVRKTTWGPHPLPGGALSADLRPRSERDTRSQFRGRNPQTRRSLRPVRLGRAGRLPEEVYRVLIESSVRIRFYGDYREVLTLAGVRSALETCEMLTEASSSGGGPLLLIVLFADDPYPTIARLSVEFAER